MVLPQLCAVRLAVILIWRFGKLVVDHQISPILVSFPFCDFVQHNVHGIRQTKCQPKRCSLQIAKLNACQMYNVYDINDVMSTLQHYYEVVLLQRWSVIEVVFVKRHLCESIYPNESASNTAHSLNALSQEVYLVAKINN